MMSSKQQKKIEKPEVLSFESMLIDSWHQRINDSLSCSIVSEDLDGHLDPESYVIFVYEDLSLKTCFLNCTALDEAKALVACFIEQYQEMFNPENPITTLIRKQVDFSSGEIVKFFKNTFLTYKISTSLQNCYCLSFDLEKAPDAEMKIDYNHHFFLPNSYFLPMHIFLKSNHLSLSLHQWQLHRTLTFTSEDEARTVTFSVSLANTKVLWQYHLSLHCGDNFWAYAQKNLFEAIATQLSKTYNLYRSDEVLVNWRVSSPVQPLSGIVAKGLLHHIMNQPIEMKLLINPKHFKVMMKFLLTKETTDLLVLHEKVSVTALLLQLQHQLIATYQPYVARFYLFSGQKETLNDQFNAFTVKDYTKNISFLRFILMLDAKDSHIIIQNFLALSDSSLLGKLLGYSLKKTRSSIIDNDLMLAVLKRNFSTKTIKELQSYELSNSYEEWVELNQKTWEEFIQKIYSKTIVLSDRALLFIDVEVIQPLESAERKKYLQYWYQTLLPLWHRLLRKQRIKAATYIDNKTWSIALVLLNDEGSFLEEYVTHRRKQIIEEDIAFFKHKRLSVEEIVGALKRIEVNLRKAIMER